MITVIVLQIELPDRFEEVLHFILAIIFQRYTQLFINLLITFEVLCRLVIRYYLINIWQ